MEREIFQDYTNLGREQTAESLTALGRIISRKLRNLKKTHSGKDKGFVRRLPPK